MNFYYKKVGAGILTLSIFFSFLLPLSMVSAQSSAGGGVVSAAVACGGGAYVSGLIRSAMSSLGNFLNIAAPGGGAAGVVGNVAKVLPTGTPSGTPGGFPAGIYGGGYPVMDIAADTNTLMMVANTNLTIGNTNLTVMNTDAIIGNSANTAGSSNTNAGNTTTLVTKEFSLDCVARELARIVLREMTDALVDWINSGFDGSPFFLEDPMGFLQSIEDSVSGYILEELGLTALCSLSADSLRLALSIDFGSRRGFQDRYACTLRDIEMNVGEIFDDFSSRSLQDYLELSLNPYDNVWGAYLGLTDEANRMITEVTDLKKEELGWGGGFFSQTDGDGKIITPGKLIENSLAESLGSEVRQLELADELNEIVSALVNALINEVMSAGGGLRGR